MGRDVVQDCRQSGPLGGEGASQLDLCLDANQGRGCAWEEVREGLTQHCLPRAHPPPPVQSWVGDPWDPHSTRGWQVPPDSFPGSPPLSPHLCALNSPARGGTSTMALSHSLTACHPLPPHLAPPPPHGTPLDQGSVICPEQAVPQQGPGKCRMG